MSDGRRLRVLHVITAAGPTNGQVNEHCLPLARDRDITICSVFPASMPMPSEITVFDGDGTTRGFLRTLERALDAADYDVIHAHAAVAGAGLLGLSLRRRRSLANCVYTIQNSYRNYKLRNRLLLYAITAAFPRIVFCSNAARDSMPGSLRWLGRRKTVVIPNAVDTSRVSRVAHSVPGRSNRPFTVVSVGRLIPIKNSVTVIEAFSRLGGSRLVFVGDGSLRATLRSEADRRSLNGQVVFTGLVDRDDVYRHVAGGDVVVSASRGEGLPVAVLEAMACARPVVLSDIPPHREIAERAPFLRLVPTEDVDAFARELGRLRDMSADERRELGQRCRAAVRTGFGLEAMHRAYVPVYTDVIRTDVEVTVPAALADAGS
jgi:glycosyltransferase involved in cell wall biosynthesis